MTNTCAHPDCDKEGTFPAPRDPRNIGARQYFCQEHIKEFNKKWNGLNGFSEDEIFSMQHGAATWNRPTWGIGVQAPTERRFESAEDLYRFFRQRRVNEARVTKETDEPSKPKLRDLPPDVREACDIFGMDSPLQGRELKTRYVELVKEHHPDAQGQQTSASESNAQQDMIKRINVAYKILSDYKPLGRDTAA